MEEMKIFYFWPLFGFFFHGCPWTKGWVASVWCEKRVFRVNLDPDKSYG